MNKNELIEGLRAHLADKDHISNEAAPALKLMRHALVELDRPATGTGNAVELQQLRSELASADSAVTQLRDLVDDREGYIYALIAGAGLMPEVDDAPVDSLSHALAISPNLLDVLHENVSTAFAPGAQADKERFINGVRALLDPIAPGAEALGLEGLWNVLETASNRYASLEAGILERDQQLEQADARLLAIREKLGIPEGAGGSVEQLELPAIDLCIQQRQEAQDRLLARIADAAGMPAYGHINKLDEHIRQIVQQRNESDKKLADVLYPVKPADDVAIDGEEKADDWLESIVEQVIAILRLDWQDVETLPQHVQKLLDDNRMLLERPTTSKPLAGWVSDAIDLAHAVRGNLAPENRVMAKAAEAIILSAPGVQDG